MESSMMRSDSKQIERVCGRCHGKTLVLLPSGVFGEFKPGVCVPCKRVITANALTALLSRSSA